MAGNGPHYAQIKPSHIISDYLCLMNPEAQVISAILHNARRLSKWYLSFLPDEKMYHRFEVNGQKLNSPYWIMAHMAQTEGSIIMEMGGPSLPSNWPKDFRLGSQVTDRQQDWPSVDELKMHFSSIHKAAGGYIKGLSTEHLDQDYPNVAFHVVFKTNREALYHIIRHESYHAGHVGLNCKMHGIKTI